MSCHEDDAGDCDIAPVFPVGESWGVENSLIRFGCSLQRDFDPPPPPPPHAPGYVSFQGLRLKAERLVVGGGNPGAVGKEEGLRDAGYARELVRRYNDALERLIYSSSISTVPGS